MSGAAPVNAGLPRRIGRAVENVILVLLAVLLFPVVVLLIGAPIAAAVRILVEIAQRLA